MIKIVKVNKLYRNSSLMSIFYPCVSKRNDEISMRGKTPNISDIPAMKKSFAD